MPESTTRLQLRVRRILWSRTSSFPLLRRLIRNGNLPVAFQPARFFERSSCDQSVSEHRSGLRVIPMKMDDCSGRRFKMIAEFFDSGDFYDLQRGVFGDGSQSSE